MGVLAVSFTGRERSFPATALPRRFLAALVFGVGRAASGIFEDQGAAIIEGDFPRDAMSTFDL